MVLLDWWGLDIRHETLCCNELVIFIEVLLVVINYKVNCVNLLENIHPELHVIQCINSHLSVSLPTLSIVPLHYSCPILSHVPFVTASSLHVNTRLFLCLHDLHCMHATAQLLVSCLFYLFNLCLHLNSDNLCYKVLILVAERG